MRKVALEWCAVTGRSVESRHETIFHNVCGMAFILGRTSPHNEVSLTTKKHSAFLAFFLEWQIPILITGISGWCTSDELDDHIAPKKSNSFFLSVLGGELQTQLDHWTKWVVSTRLIT